MSAHTVGDVKLFSSSEQAAQYTRGRLVNIYLNTAAFKTKSTD